MRSLSVLFLILGCGTGENLRTRVGPPGEPADPCSVEQTDAGAVVSCPDGSQATLEHGQAGQVGPAGPAGGCTVTKLEYTSVISCSDGTVAEVKDGQSDENAELIYEGEACGRTVVRLGKDWYVAASRGLHPLSKDWYEVTSRCSVRVVDSHLEMSYD